MMKYEYRRLFHLSSKELAEEPVDEFYTNLHIYAQIQEKKRIEAKHGSS